MQQLVDLLRRRAGIRVFRQSFWMAHYYHPNHKLTKIWSCARSIWKLDFGKLPVQQKKGPSTTRKYVNAKGEIRFTATAALKKSQYFGT